MASAKEIPPGEEGKIKVTFKTAHRTGINKHNVTVTSNDQANPNLQLEVVADLYQLLTVAPTRQWFGQVKQAEEATRQFVFEGLKVNEVEFTSLRLKEDSKNQDAYTWKINDDKSDGTRKLSLDVTVHGDKIPPGRFGDVLIIETNLEPSVTLELVLTGEILGPVSVSPQRLYFGQFEKDQEMENILKLTANTEIPFKILSASIEDPEFKIDPWERDALLEHTMTVRFLPKETRDRIRTSLSIKTDLKSQPIVEVEIHAYQRRTRSDGTMQSMDARTLNAPVKTRDDAQSKTRSLSNKLTP